MKRLIFLFFALLLIIIIPGCSSKTEQYEYITIGALLPLTGDGADEGLRAFNGLQLAKREINKNGGIRGKLLDIIVLNDRGDEDYIVQQYNRLMEMGVVAIIGSSYSSVTLALAKASVKDGIPVISPTATNPDVTLGHRNVFRAIFINDYQAEVLAYFAFNSLNARTALVLVNDDFAGNKRVAEVFIECFEKYGGEITAIEPVSSADEHAGILAKYSANKPDVIFYPDDYIPAAMLVNTAYEIGFAGAYILGTDAWDGFLPYISATDALKNVYYTSTFSFDDDDPEVVRFVRDYFNLYSQMPLSGSATAYTCVYILVEAINMTGYTTKDVLIYSLKATELNTITGRIKFDNNNNPRTNVYIIKTEGGIIATYEKLSL